jgi:hypothetical protein
MNISFIIPTHNSKEDLRHYLDSFLRYNSAENIFFKVIDTSEDWELLKIVQDYSGRIKIEVHFIDNRGYAAACNFGYHHTERSDVYIFSNPDIIFSSDIIERIKAEFDDHTYGTIIQKDRHLKNCTFNLYPQYRNILTEVLLFHKILNRSGWYDPAYISISGAFMVVGRTVIEKNGLFDENYFLYYEEDDFFYRLRKNRNFKIIRDRYILHNISSSIDRNLSLNKFKIQFDSLYYYSKKFGTFSYFKNLISLYKFTSLFIPKHKGKLRLMLGKDPSR